MKLTKLFLLIPAFMMVACAQNQQGSESQSQTSSSSSEEVKTYEVTEEEFASIITNRGLIALDANQTFDVRGDFTGSALVVTGKADNGTYECFATMTNSEQQISTLIHSIYQVDTTVPIAEDSYHGDYYTQDGHGAWTVTPNKEMTLDDLMASTAVLYNFEMSEFAFNDTTNQYVATPAKDISLLGFGVTVNSVKLQFKNGKLDNYDLDATIKMLGAPLVLHGQIMDVGSTTIKVPQA